MNLVSLLMLPAIISFRDNTGVRLTIALAALVTLGAAIIYSKRAAAIEADYEPAGVKAA
jgi:hypothetical protein